MRWRFLREQFLFNVRASCWVKAFGDEDGVALHRNYHWTFFGVPAMGSR